MAEIDSYSQISVPLLLWEHSKTNSFTTGLPEYISQVRWQQGTTMFHSVLTNRMWAEESSKNARLGP